MWRCCAGSSAGSGMGLGRLPLDPVGSPPVVRLLSSGLSLRCDRLGGKVATMEERDDIELYGLGFGVRNGSREDAAGSGRFAACGPSSVFGSLSHWVGWFGEKWGQWRSGTTSSSRQSATFESHHLHIRSLRVVRLRVQVRGEGSSGSRTREGLWLPDEPFPDPPAPTGGFFQERLNAGDRMKLRNVAAYYVRARRARQANI
jgi:hypothetical protein